MKLRLSTTAQLLLAIILFTLILVCFGCVGVRTLQRNNKAAVHVRPAPNTKPYTPFLDKH